MATTYPSTAPVYCTRCAIRITPPETRCRPCELRRKAWDGRA